MLCEEYCGEREREKGRERRVAVNCSCQGFFTIKKVTLASVIQLDLSSGCWSLSVCVAGCRQIPQILMNYKYD